MNAEKLEKMKTEIVKHFERLWQIELYWETESDKCELAEYIIFDWKFHLELYKDEVEVRTYNKKKKELENSFCCLPLTMFHGALVSNFAYLRDVKL